MMVFVCHPYHRGGVTSWMSNAFLVSKSSGIPSKFITVKPNSQFISGGNRPTMVSLIGKPEGVHHVLVGQDFELGTNEYRVDIYRNLILDTIPQGATLIPSDDEVCWIACLSLSKFYKVVGVLHSDDPFYYNLYKKYRPYLSATVSVSCRIRNIAELVGSCPFHEVIPCGIFLDQLASTSDKLNWIIWIGRVEEEQKRVSDIIPIASRLKNKMDDWKILVFGDGSQLVELKRLAIYHGLDNHIEFFGWSSREIIDIHLKKAKIILQTSNYEGMSVAVMEGLAAGCVVVSSHVSGVEDLLEDSANSGLIKLYPIGNVELAALHLIDSLGEYSVKKGSQAVLFAEKHFSIYNCIQKYRELSEKLEINSCEFFKLGFLFKYKVKFSWVIAGVRAIKHKLLS